MTEHRQISELPVSTVWGRRDNIERDTGITIDVLSGHTLRKAGVKYGLSGDRVHQIVKRYCRVANLPAYMNLIAERNITNALRKNRLNFIPFFPQLVENDQK